VNKREISPKLQQFEIGDLQVDPRCQEVTRGGDRIDLTGLSYRLLEVLANRWPAVVSRRELAREVWGDIVVSDDALRQRVRLLRRSLGKSGYISAVKGVGYRLAGPVRPITVTENRRQFLAAAIVFALGLIAVVVMSGDPGAEIWHQIKHLIKH